MNTYFLEQLMTSPSALPTNTSPVALAPCVLTIGNFDGVHRGHQEVIRAAQEYAAQHSGTAAVLTPIGRLAGEGFDLTVGDGTSGGLTMSVREELTDIQNGKRPDTRGWMHRLA